MPTPPRYGRSLVTRQAVVDLVRTATLGSYGVTGFAGRLPERLLERIGLAQPGIAVHLGEAVDIDLDLTVAYGVPVAEVRTTLAALTPGRTSPACRPHRSPADRL